MTESGRERASHLTSPRAAALAGVLFAVLFGTAIYLIRSSLSEVVQPGSQWLDSGDGRIGLASDLTPFAGIAFLWFIGVVRANLDRYEDQISGTVMLGSGLLFLAMVFASSAVGASMAESRRNLGPDVRVFGQTLLLELSETYALRMAAVFMISLATIWMRTGLMPRWLVYATYLTALTLIVTAADGSMWLTLVFPAWVLIVSMLFLIRADAFESYWQSHREDKRLPE